jgi:DNA anti-recombination protein RmuC
MSDENVIGTPDAGETSGAAETAAGAAGASEASAAWRDVVAELDALGEAVGRWVKAAVSDEENKRRAAELTAAFERLAAQVGETVRSAADSEVGQSFKEAADKTGEAFKKAGEKLSEEAGPKLASAFRTLSEKLRSSAERIEERVQGEPGQEGASAESGAAPEGQGGTGSGERPVGPNA